MRSCKFLSFLVFIILSFCVSVFAQNVENKEQTFEEKQAEAEVRKFADSFLDSFIETQDIEQIPQGFFDKDFKKRFVENSDLKHLFTVKNEIFSIEERRKHIADFHNFLNLYMLLMSFCPIKEKADDDSDDEDEKFTELILKCMPPKIHDEISQSKWLKMFVNDDINSTDPKGYSEIAEYHKEMVNIADSIRNYFYENPIKNAKYLPQLKQKLFEYYPADKCEGDKCMGLPEGTEIFAIHQLMMCLRITKIDGQWKIIQIFSVASES